MNEMLFDAFNDEIEKTGDYMIYSDDNILLALEKVASHRVLPADNVHSAIEKIAVFGRVAGKRLHGGLLARAAHEVPMARREVLEATDPQRLKEALRKKQEGGDWKAGLQEVVARPARKVRADRNLARAIERRQQTRISSLKAPPPLGKKQTGKLGPLFATKSPFYKTT